MAPRGIVCRLCGKQFFKHSLPIHMPQCERKFAAVEVPCPFCDEEFRQDELEEHKKKCRRRPRLREHRSSWNADTAGSIPETPAIKAGRALADGGRQDLTRLKTIVVAMVGTSYCSGHAM